MEPQVITLVTNWPQAIVAVVLIVALLIWPGVMSWVQARRSATTVHETHRSLTQANGGSSVKDALDRIEARQEAQGQALAGLGERMTAVEEMVTRPSPHGRP